MGRPIRQETLIDRGVAISSAGGSRCFGQAETAGPLEC